MLKTQINCRRSVQTQSVNRLIGIANERRRREKSPLESTGWGFSRDPNEVETIKSLKEKDVFGDGDPRKSERCRIKTP